MISPMFFWLCARAPADLLESTKFPSLPTPSTHGITVDGKEDLEAYLGFRLLYSDNAWGYVAMVPSPPTNHLSLTRSSRTRRFFLVDSFFLSRKVRPIKYFDFYTID
jgi:hypothetical protein